MPQFLSHYFRREDNTSAGRVHGRYREPDVLVALTCFELWHYRQRVVATNPLHVIS